MVSRHRGLAQACKNVASLVEHLSNGTSALWRKNYESIHNYIDFKDFVLRKGAISANENKLCLIALNMRDGVLLCKGKGNEKWNNSSAHGSGRIITRQKALKSKIPIMKRLEKDFEENEIYSTNILSETGFKVKKIDLIKNIEKNYINNLKLFA